MTLSKFKQNQILLVYLMWFVEHNVYSLPRRAESQFKTMKTHEIFNVIKMYGASKKKKKRVCKMLDGTDVTTGVSPLLLVMC